MVTQTKMVAAICAGNFYPLTCHGIDCVVYVETRGHLKVDGQPRVMSGALLFATFPTQWVWGWDRGWGLAHEIPCPCWWGPRDRRLGRERPWEGDALRPKISCGEVSPQPLEVRPEDPLPPIQCLAGALVGLCLEKVQKGNRQGWLPLGL